MDAPSFFGEVLPLDGRLDDVDDDFLTPVDSSYEVLPLKCTPVDDVDTVIVAVGQHAVEFARVALLSENDSYDEHDEIRRVVLRPTISHNDRHYVLSVKHVPHRRLAVVLCRAAPPDDYAYDCWMQLTKCFTTPPSSVFTLSSQAAQLYVKLPTSPDASLRILANDQARTRWPQLCDAADWLKVMPPNVLSGVAAAAISWCLHSHITCCALVTYFESTDRIDFRNAAAQFARLAQLNDKNLPLNTWVPAEKRVLELLQQRGGCADPQLYA